MAGSSKGSFFRREPKQSRSRALVEAIVEAADELIRRGATIDSVTVERVSERAGVGMGSFYEYFRSRDSLLGVLIGKVTRSNFDELTRKLDAIEGDSLEVVVRGFARCIVEQYLAHPNRTRVIIEGTGRIGLISLIHEEKDRFARVLAQRAVVLVPGSRLEDLESRMRVVADAVMGVIGFAAMRGDPIDHERLAGDLATMALEILAR